MTEGTTLGRALAIQAISRGDGESRVGAALAVLRADALTGAHDGHPACVGAADARARLMALTPADMPPGLDDVALLLEAASQRLGGVGHAAVWQSIGVGRDRGRNFLSPRGIGALDWPIWRTLREAGLGD
jgi:hypothetical protein